MLLRLILCTESEPSRDTTLPCHPFESWPLSVRESRRADSNRLPLLQLRVCLHTF